MNAAGAQVAFAGTPRSNMLKVLDVELVSIGNVHPDDGSYLTFEFQERDRYAFLVFRDGHLEGAILLGDTRLSAKLKTLIEKQLSCAELLKRHTKADALLEALARS